MAVFNPNVPQTNDPNWLSWSKGISQPESDKSAGVALQGISSVLDSGIKATDALVKSSISDEIYSRASAERDSYLTSLQSALNTKKATAAPGMPQDVSPGTETETDLQMDLINKPADPSMPTDLTNMGQSLDVLQGARANGKISETAYYGRLRALAKEFRDRYPGYREYVDAQVSKVTGVDPANAEIKSLIQDLNSYKSGTDAVRNRAISFLQQHFGEIPEAPMLMNGLLAGTMTPQKVYEKMYPILARDAKWKANQAMLADWKGSRELRAINYLQGMTEDANESAAHNIDALVVSIGGEEPQKVVDLLTAQKQGKLKLKDEEWDMIGRYAEVEMANWERAARARYNAKIPGTNESSYSIVGQEKSEAAIKAAKENHQELIRQIYNKDAGAALTTKNLITHQGTEAVKALMDNNPAIRILKGANDIGGPDFAAQMLKAQLGIKVTPAQAAAVQAALTNIQAQPNIYIGGRPPLGDKPNGKPVTQKGTVETLKKAGIPVDEASKAILDLHSKIADPNYPDSGKLALAKAAFDNSNNGFLSLYSSDKLGYDGKPIKGKYTIFSDMTSPAITKEMWRLGQMDRSVWRDYVNWAANSFGTELFKPEISDLSLITKDPQVKLRWDPENHQFRMDYGRFANVNLSGGIPLTASERALMPPIDMNRIKAISSKINKINVGLSSISNIYKQAGLDPNPYVLNLLAGLNPTGIPKEMLDDVVEKGKPKKVE